MTDDIAHIESQNRGLQVQTSNQRALLAELDKLMVRCRIFYLRSFSLAFLSIREREESPVMMG